MRIAILDDYQGVSPQLADWSQLPPAMEVQMFLDHLSDEDALVERLKDFQVIMGMRERTAFPGSLLKRLPELRLLITKPPAGATPPSISRPPPNWASFAAAPAALERARLSSPGD